MAQNAQQKRVSKNRVSITFDVEDGGAVQQKELAFSNEEEERRQKWIEHYLSTGDIEKAKELGYVEKADWQVHMEQEAAEQASLPSLDDLLD